MELGVFVEVTTAAGASTNTKLVEILPKHAWQGPGSSAVRQVFNPKLLQSSGKYRGKASETMSVLPLVV